MSSQSVAGEKLRARWLAEGKSVRPGVPLETIRRFEELRALELPDDVVAYFTSVDGTDAMDSKAFRFWRFEELKTVPDDCPEYADFPDAGDFFVFADYLVWSLAYAIRLGPKRSTQAGEVIVLGAPPAAVVAPSFQAFVDLYLADDPSLTTP